MRRRDLFHLAAMSTASSLLHDHAVAQTVDPWSAGFTTALRNNPYLEGYKGVTPETMFDANVTFDKAPPDGLDGTLYRIGPALHEMGGLRYHHWFDGDGMTQAFHIGNGRVAHKGRLVMTEKLKKEVATGHRRRDAFGTAIAGADPITEPDTINVANTSILPFASDLLALWEGGSAYRIEPSSLATIGPKIWTEDLAGMPFSAHPKIDTAGALWNFGLDTSSSTILLYRITNNGDVADAKPLHVPNMTMVHDFVVTSRHLVFLLPPIRFLAEKFQTGTSFNESHEWQPGAPLRVLVVDKSDLQTHHLFELPAGFLFHFGNAWEDEAGIIRFDYARANDAQSLFVSFREVMRGVVTEIRRPTQATIVSLDLTNGRISQQSIPGAVEFPRVDPRVVGQRYRHVFHAARTAPNKDELGFDAIRRTDLESGQTDTWRYGNGIMAEEHLLVPDRQSSTEGVGWLVGTSLDVKQGRTMLSVFNAMRLSDGPIATARLPYALPLGLHGNFKAG